MNKLSFEYYRKLKEMATLDFGSKRGKHLNDISVKDPPRSTGRTSYPKWMLDMMEKDPRSSHRLLSDKEGKPLSRDQVKSALDLRLSGSRETGTRLAPTSIHEPVKPEAPKAPEGRPSMEPVQSPITSVEKPPAGSADSDDQKVQEFDPEPYRIKPDWITKHQKDIRDVFSGSKSHIILPALAGSGKTTMLKDLASNAKPGERWLYLVFNKKNQIESKKAFPPGVEVFTSHSFLEQRVFSANKEALPSSSIFDKEKDDRDSQYEAKAEMLIANIVFGDNNYIDKSNRGFVKNACYNLLSKAKNFALHPEKEDLPVKLKEIINKYKIDTKPKFSDGQPKDYAAEIISICSEVLKATMPKSKGAEMRSLRDHDDTLWWTAIHADELKWPSYDVVLADEVQDFNVCQQIMLKKLEEAGARIIAVGDENQAIYAFRGADAGSFSALGKVLGSTGRGVESRNLPVNFRSSPAIIKYVNDNTIVSNLEAGKTHDGSVEENSSEALASSSIRDEWSRNKELSQETAFLSRTNKALAPIALELLIEDIPVTIVGRNLAEEFTNFMNLALWFDKEPDLKYQKGSFFTAKKRGIRGFLGKNIKDVPGALMDFYDWRSSNPKANQKILKEEERTAGNLSHLIDILVEKGSVKTVKDFIDYLKAKLRGLDLGTDGGGGNDKDIETYEARKNNPRKHVVLSTVHKSKGLEFERVFVLENDALPTHEASRKRRGDSSLDQESAQEENLKYVAYTRAKNQLHLINNAKRN